MRRSFIACLLASNALLSVSVQAKPKEKKPEEAAEPAAPAPEQPTEAPPASVATPEVSAPLSGEATAAPPETAIASNELPKYQARLLGGFSQARDFTEGDEHGVPNFGARFAYMGISRVFLELRFDISQYARNYQITQPSGVSSISTNELRLQPGLVIGWDALDSWRKNEEKFGLLPSLRVDYLSFDNPLAANGGIPLGAGVEAFYRPDPLLNLNAEVSYQYVVGMASDVAKTRLTAGLPVSLLRYAIGPSLNLGQRWSLGFRYSGEWLVREHSDRIAQGFDASVQARF